MTESLKNICIAISALAVAVAAGAVAIVGMETRQAVREIRPQTVELLRQGKYAAFEVQATAKAIKEETGNPEDIKARSNTIRFANHLLVEGSKTLDQINTSTLPKVNAAIARTESLIANSDHSINTVLIPSASRVTDNLASLASQFQVDQRQLTLQLAAAVKQGEVSLEALSRLLNSDRMTNILENIDRTTNHFDGTAANLEMTTAQLPELASRVNSILKTSNQFQKPLLIASLLATLARAFF